MSRKELNRLQALVYKNKDGLTATSAASELKNTKQPKESYDVWETNPTVTIPVKRPSTLSKLPESLTENNAKVPNVVIADPGMSYNPDAAAWMKLLDTKGSEELKKEQKRISELEEKERIQKKAFEDKGLVSDQDVNYSIDSDDQSEHEQAETPIPSLKNKRKTRSQRNKIRQRREEELRLLEQKKNEELLRTIDKAPAISKKLQQKDKAEKFSNKAVSSSTTEIKLKKKKFGKHRLPNNPLEIKLGDELTSSLRELKPEGNLFADRYLSLQQRAMVPPSLPVLKKSKYRAKIKEKYSHKDFHLQKNSI